jgi:hypothetical protein
MELGSKDTLAPLSESGPLLLRRYNVIVFNFSVTINFGSVRF